MTGLRAAVLAKWAWHTLVVLGLALLLTLSFHPAGGATPPADPQHHRPAAVGGPPTVRGPAKPPPANKAHPANRPQTSLEKSAGSRHAIRSGKPEHAGPPPKRRGKVLPSQALAAGATEFGGCLREYGQNGECLPVIPPSMASHVRDMEEAGLDVGAMKHHWSCEEVRRYFRDGVTVRQKNVDPQRLDTNGDGTACGQGDR